MDIKKQFKDRIWAAVLAVIFLAISYVWFGDGISKATGESGPVFLNLPGYLSLTYHAWSDVVLGQTSFSLNGALPIYFVLNIFLKFVSSGYVEGLFFLISMLLAGIGFGLLLRRLFPKTNQFMLFFISLAYAFNPYSVAFIWNRFLYNYILAYGLFPYIIFLWVSFLEEGRYKHLLYFFVSSILFSFAFTAVPFFIVCIVSLFFWSLLYFATSEERKVFSDRVKRFFGLTIVFFLSQAFWIFPFVGGNKPEVNLNFSFFSESGNLKTTVDLSRYYGGLVNLLRMYRADMFVLANDNVHLAQWYTGPIAYYASYFSLLAIMVLLFITIRRYRSKKIIGLVTLFLVWMIFVNGTNFPLNKLFLLFYKINPILGLLRNPLEKGGSIFYMHFFILAAAGYTLILKAGNKIIRYFLILGGLVWLVVSLVPVFNGLVFTYKYDLNYDTKKGFKVIMPSYYPEAKDYLRKASELSRFIALPIYGEGMTYNWDLGYDGVEVSNALLNQPFISLDTTSYGLHGIVNTLRKLNTKNILKVAGQLNTSKIMVRNDIKNIGDYRLSSQFNQEFESILNLTPQSFGDLKFYDVPDEYIKPRLFIASNPILSNNADISNYEFFNYDYNSVFISQTGNFSLSEDIIIPEYSVEEKTYDQPSNTENVFDELPYAKYSPSSKLYPLIRIKEYLWQKLNEDNLQDISITLAGKRLQEIAMLVNQNDLNYIDKSIENYKSNVTPLLLEAKNQISSGSDPLFWWNTFWYHRIALNKLVQISPDSVKGKITGLEGWFNNELFLSGVISESDLLNGSNEGDLYVKRFLFKVTEDGDFNLRLGLGFNDLIPEKTIRLDGVLKQVNFTLQPDNLYQAKVHLEKGEHEVKIAVRIRFASLSDEELVFDKGDKVSDGVVENKTWLLDAPEGNGFYIPEFEYRIIKGSGPVLASYRMPDGVLIGQSSRFYNDGYYFDWRKATIGPYNSNWLSQFEFDIKAELYNSCDFGSESPLCDDELQKKWLDKPSSFVIKNLRIKFIPDMSLALVKTDLAANQSGNIELNWQRLGPSLYILKSNVNGGNKVLTFLEQYHPSWQLIRVDNIKLDGKAHIWELADSNEYDGKFGFLDRFKIISNAIFSSKKLNHQHIMVNGYANGWIIGEGDYNWVLIYKPELYWYLGIGVTSVGFTGFIFVYLRKILKRRR